MKSASVLLLLLTLPVSCDRPSEAAPSFSEVLNPAPHPDSVIQASEVFILGKREGEGPETFGRIEVLAVDGRGRIHVVDTLVHEIRVFDGAGQFVRSLGREEEGSGGFERIWGLDFHPDGSIWVWDPPQQRFSVFDSVGTFLQSVPREWRGAISPWPGQFDDDGRFLDLALEHRGFDREVTETQELQTIFTPIRFDDQLQVIDSLAPLVTSVRAWGGNYRMPFERGLVYAFEPNGSAWFTEGHGYRVLRRDAEGDTTLAFSLDIDPPSVTRAERDSVLEQFSAYASGSGLDPDLIPDTRSAIARLIRLAPGWVGVFPHLGPDTGRYIDVFTPAGIHRARIDLGYALSLTSPAPCFRDGVLFGVVRDELEVQYVVALDLGLDDFPG